LANYQNYGEAEVLHAGRTRRINQSVTWDTVKVVRGATLQPANGVTVTIGGFTEPVGPFQWIDTSLGGAVVFAPGIIGHALPQWWGAIGDETVDGLVGLRAAIASRARLDFGDGIYRVTGEIGQETIYNADYPLHWTGRNARIVLDSDAHVERLCHVLAQGTTAFIEGITFDAALKANVPLAIENPLTGMEDEDLSTLDLSRVKGINAYRADDEFDDGARGIHIQGAFKSVLLRNGTGAKNCVLGEGAGTAGVVGVVGIGVSAFSSTCYPIHTTADGIEVEDIYSEDLAYNDDQDGIVIAGVDGGGSRYPTHAIVTGGSTFRNCWGRSIKTQTDFSKVSGATFYRDAGPTDGGNNEISIQFAALGQVDDIDCYYDGETPDSVVQFVGGATRPIGSHSVNGVRVYMTADTVLNRVVQTFPNDGQLGPVRVSRVDVFGGEVGEVLDFLINGNVATNHARVSDCFAEELKVHATSGNYALVRVRASGATSPYRGTVVIDHCGYGGAEDALVAEAGITGTSAEMVCSAYDNMGFVDDRTIAPDAAGKSRQVSYLGSIGPALRDDHASTTLFAAHEVFCKSVEAAATWVVPVRTPALFGIISDYGNTVGAMLAVDQTGVLELTDAADIEVGTTSEPGSGTFRVWASDANEISISNHDASARKITIWVLSAG
jgi:hypothetical protein